MQATTGLWARTSLPSRILCGLGAGIFAGLFVGEHARNLQPIADIYIRLMQMTVLPYLVTALVVAFGQLSADNARRLAVRGGVLLLVVWFVTCAIIAILPRTLPTIESAAFFSDALVEPVRPFSLTDIYFTANPFESLSKSVVPAVVLFSCLFGIGLMNLRDKDKLLAPMRIWNEAVGNITRFVVELTPIGVFAIGAVTAGTMMPETFTRLEAYFIIFAVSSMLLAFWILPLLVTAVTPFRYAEVAGIARGALLTAFVTNNAFIVLPLLIVQSKELLRRHDLLDETTDAAAEVIVPVLFNFPNAGKLLTLMFVPFAAWLSGAPLAGHDYWQLFAAGIPSYFAKAQVALPFLLDLFGLPHDLFQLYIPTTIITGKFDSLLTALNLLVFALLGAGALGGFLVFERARLLRAAAAIALGTAGVVLLTRLMLVAMVDTSYHGQETVRNMQMPAHGIATIVHREGLANAEPDSAGRPSTLAEIRARGTLRIGYDPHNLPMSFFNTGGELVGFDVELGTRLADALGLRPEFVPLGWPDVPRMIGHGLVDVMPGVWYRPYWFGKLRLTQPYFTGTVALVTRDERRHEFDSVMRLRQSHGLRIGVPLDVTQIATSMEYYFGGSDAEFVVIEFWSDIFEGRRPELDAFLMPAEHASAWSLIYPQYSVVVPQPDPVGIATAFGVAPQSEELANLLNEWVTYATNVGLTRQAHAYWVTGKGAIRHEPRWSIMRNVLGWGD